jgi:3-phenylpropionate/trans-cinnamate dioxygenase ferredoxin subunit
MFSNTTTWFRLFDSLTAAENMLAEKAVTTMHVGGKKVCIARFEGKFYAMADKCPHNGASLGNGYCSAEGSVVCPLHRYHFDLRTGRARSGLGDVAQVYPLEIREDGIYIGFSRFSFF